MENNFHIKLVPYDGSNDYRIVFTNNNWVSQSDLMKLWDFTGNFGCIHTSVSWAIGTEEEMTVLAKQFNSFEECVDYNRNIKKAEQELIKTYTEMGIPSEKPEETVKSKLPEINIR